MSQSDTGRSSMDWNMPMMPDVAGMGKRSAEAISELQKEILEAFERANRNWVACLNEEATLMSDLIKKVGSSGSIPDSMAAYQAWAKAHMDLLTKHGQKCAEDTQNLMKAYTRVIGNGGLGGK
jgi:hypothetical protein